MTPTDTIVAAATPPGRGGIGIVRLSGPAAPRIAAVLTGLEGASLPPRTAVRARFLDDDGGAIDSGLVLRFAAPRSYTGEEVIELHGHGGPVIMEALVARAVALGARH
ncbi:MAG: tRNA uridine-5-carboxymethylaminomethyl(34) synthesis GTPase MnmE, partial [Steroidobacteraceae bacterium]